jgi:hypothetical protein
VDGIQLITELAEWLSEPSEVADISVHTSAAGEIVLSVTIRPQDPSPQHPSPIPPPRHRIDDDGVGPPVAFASALRAQVVVDRNDALHRA